MAVLDRHVPRDAAVGLSTTLCRHVAGARFADLPPGAVAAAKRSLLDGLGVMLAASGMGEGCAAFVELARDGAGAPQATVLGHGIRTTAPLAALANGAMAHALDFEDAYDGAPVHPNAVAIPAALATAERLGGVDGERLLLALAVGCDLVCRLGLALEHSPDELGFYPPPILGALGAAAAVCVVLGCDEREVRDALSLALCQAVCSAELKRSPDSTVRAVRDAFPAQAAVLAGELARRGVRGFDEPLEGRAGFFAMYARGAYDPGVVLEGLGREFHGERVSYKPWPSCRGTHAFVEAALELAAGGLRPEAIGRVRLYGHPMLEMLDEPRAQKRRPATAIDAKFSLPFCVASALVHRRLELESFSPAARADERVLALAARVELVTVPDADPSGGRVEVVDLDGRRREHAVACPVGHPSRPLDDAALIDKFTRCAALAAHPPADPRVLADAILALERSPDAVADLVPR